MKLSIVAALTVLGLPLAARAAPGGTVAGKVVLDAPGVAEPGPVVVYVVGFDEPAPRTPATIVQKDKEFRPELVAVTAGQTVSFPNEDTFFTTSSLKYQGFDD